MAWCASTTPPRTGTAASAGLDYRKVSGQLTWDEGDLEVRRVRVPLLDNTDADGAREFRLVLSDPRGGALLAEDGSTISIRILDDD